MNAEKRFNDLFRQKGGTWADKEIAKFWFLAGTRIQKEKKRPQKPGDYSHVKKDPLSKQDINAVHYMELADMVYLTRMAERLSERELATKFEISKSEIHRLIVLAELDLEMRQAAKEFNIEKYVLLEWHDLNRGVFKDQIREMVLSGTMTKRWQLTKLIQQRQDKR